MAERAAGGSNAILDKINQLPPEDRDMLLKILRQSLEDMMSAPKIPMAPGRQTPEMPTVPRGAKRDLIVDVDALIELFSSTISPNA